MKGLTWDLVDKAIRTLSSIALTAFAVGLTLILWLGAWPSETSEARIRWLGVSLIAVHISLCLALFLSSRGIQSFSIKAGPVDVSLNDTAGGGGSDGPKG